MQLNGGFGLLSGLELVMVSAVRPGLALLECNHVAQRFEVQGTQTPELNVFHRATVQVCRRCFV